MDGNEVLLKDDGVLNIANEFGLTQAAVNSLKDTENSSALTAPILWVIDRPMLTRPSSVMRLPSSANSLMDCPSTATDKSDTSA